MLKSISCQLMITSLDTPAQQKGTSTEKIFRSAVALLRHHSLNKAGRRLKASQTALPMLIFTAAKLFPIGLSSMVRSYSRRDFMTHSVAMMLLYRPASAAGRALPPAPALQPALYRFSYQQVQLGDSRLLEQLVHNRSLFMSISDDKLLKPFRVRARQPAPGEDMGGWYDASDDFHIDASDYGSANWHGYIPGHSFGQYLSGLSRCYAASGDAAIQRKVADLVRKYAATIHPLFFAGYPLPAYTYDKLVIGLVDAYQYAGVALAKPTLDHLTDVVMPFLPEKALTRDERRARPYTQEAEIWDEPYTLPEHLFLA